MYTVRITMPTQRLTAWIAALAMVVAALMPTITQAASSGGQAWLEVCTVYGVERLVVDSDPDVQGDGTSASGMACPWCHLPIGLPDTPDSATPGDIAYGAGRIVVAHEQQFSRTRAGATSSRPRAPPQNV